MPQRGQNNVLYGIYVSEFHMLQHLGNDKSGKSKSEDGWKGPLPEKRDYRTRCTLR